MPTPPPFTTVRTADRRSAWPRATLRTYLVVVILAATVPLAVLMSLQLIGDVRRQDEALRANLRGVANAVAVGIDREIVASTDALEVLGQADSLQHGDRDGFATRLRTRGLLRDSWQRLVLLDDDGRLRIDVVSPGERMVPLQNTEAAALARRWREAPGDVLVVSLVGDSVAMRTTWVGRRVAVADGTRYLLAARVGLETWQALLEGAAPEGGGFVTLFDEGHVVIARTLDPAQSIGRPLPAAGVAGMASAPAGVQRAAMLGGGDAYVAWQNLRRADWGIGVGTAAAPIDAAHDRAVLVTFGTAAACLLLGVGAALLVARRVARPLRRLVMRGAGGHVVDEPIEVAEIAQLRDALAALERERRRSAAHLAKQAEEFETLFRTSPTGLAFAQDADCRHVLTNAEMDAMLPGLAGHDEAGREAVDVEVVRGGRVLAPDEQPLARAARHGVNVGTTELEIRRPGRPSQFVLASAVPLADAAGRPRGAIGSATDVTERKHAEQALAVAMEREQQARREAEAANRAKDELLSMLGHELRNPLNAIVTSVEVLKRAAPDAAVAESARAVLARQTRKLASMVDQLLDVGQVMADEVTLQRRPLDLAALAAAGIEAARPAAAERRQQVEAAGLGTVWVDGDPRRLSQVIDHLLDNALKHTPAGGRVEVEVGAAADGAALLRVRDHGPGIAPELLARMFEPFVQGERGLARSAGGLGIGLTLVQRLVAMHGGTVAARSSADGSLFEVRLPAFVTRGAAPPGRTSRVGVIDDNPDALTTMRSMLELAGHTVQTAPDGETGLAFLITDAPDVAIVDIGLPGIDGYEVARRSRAAGFRGRLIALSGYGTTRDLQRSLSEGFDAHLVKPVDPEQLLPLLHAA